jgi:hypothetical protein
MAPTKGFKRKQAGKFTGDFYDQSAQYGRTKNKPYYATQKGAFDAQANKEDFYQWLLGERGALAGPTPIYGGATPFGQFLQNDYFDTLQTGYNAARGQSGGRLEFRDYMKGVGYGVRNSGAGFGDAALGSAGAPNPFTTSTLQPTGQPAQPSGVDHARRAFLSLTPQQRGADRPATGYRPGRWSVF